MLKQKEYDLQMLTFKKKNMEGYKQWFDNNVNCEVKDDTGKTTKWKKGIQLHSRAKNYAVIAMESGIVYRVHFNAFRNLNNI